MNHITVQDLKKLAEAIIEFREFMYGKISDDEVKQIKKTLYKLAEAK